MITGARGTNNNSDTIVPIYMGFDENYIFMAVTCYLKKSLYVIFSSINCVNSWLQKVANWFVFKWTSHKEERPNVKISCISTKSMTNPLHLCQSDLMAKVLGDNCFFFVLTDVSNQFCSNKYTKDVFSILSLLIR